MRSFKTKPIADENIILRGKSQTLSSSDKREALGDVTNIKNESNNSNVSNSNLNPKKLLASKHTASKIQIYKQHNSHQFKKPRLNRILQEKSDVKDEDFDTCDEDSGDDDKENKGEEDNENIDESDKENYINHHNSKFSENFSDNVSDDILHKHFDKLAQDDIHSLSPEEVINYSDIIDEVAFPKGHDHRIVDEVEEEEEEEEENLKHKPMEPVWTNAIYNELQHVVRKYSRSTLDENDEDTFDVTMVAEYAPEIFNYLHELENRLAPDGSYMENQDELKWEMRSVLIDWVVQVHSRFNLLPETLYLTVNYIDRFLSKRKVSLSRFQLVGAVALFIAAKYEEINCPTVQEVAYMADNAYSIDDFLKAERFMIDVLEFDMGWPGPMSFLRRTSKADDYDYETRTLAKYFLEITIMDSRFVASQPSWLAAGAHYLSRRILNKGEWSELHVFYSGYTESQLRPLAEVLLGNCRVAETNHKAIFEKYQERRYRRSSAFVQEYFLALD